MAIVRQVRSQQVDWRPTISETYDDSGSARAVQFINYLLTIVESVLLFRFVLKLFGANPNNGFASFIYDLTSPLIAPFRGLFATPADNGAVFDSAAIVAMIVYAVIAYLVTRFFFAASSEETVEYHEPDIR
jgi:uncharacterized protein YggT (Ycf19 family)